MDGRGFMETRRISTMLIQSSSRFVYLRKQLCACRCWGFSGPLVSRAGWRTRGIIMVFLYGGGSAAGASNRMKQVQLQKLKWGCGRLHRLETMASLIVVHSFHPVFHRKVCSRKMRPCDASTKTQKKQSPPFIFGTLHITHLSSAHNKMPTYMYAHFRKLTGLQSIQKAQSHRQRASQRFIDEQWVPERGTDFYTTVKKTPALVVIIYYNK